MKAIFIYLQITLVAIFFLSSKSLQKPKIENQTWVLFKIREPQTRKEIYVDEYHYLNFGNGHVSFRVDCNSCSDSVEFISKDSIYFYGNQMCTRKGCLEKDKINTSYSGKYRIWIEGSTLVIRTSEGDHIYK